MNQLEQNTDNLLSQVCSELESDFANWLNENVFKLKSIRS